MSRVVPDASVLIKLFIDEPGSAKAVAAIKKAKHLIAPDLLWPEVGNILWKYVRRGELQAKEAQALLEDMLQMPIELVKTQELIEDALVIATEFGRSVYDSLYLAVALHSKAVFLTADTRLVNALSNTSLAGAIRNLH